MHASMRAPPLLCRRNPASLRLGFDRSRVREPEAMSLITIDNDSDSIDDFLRIS